MDANKRYIANHDFFGTRYYIGRAYNQDDFMRRLIANQRVGEPVVRKGQTCEVICGNEGGLLLYFINLNISVSIPTKEFNEYIIPITFKYNEIWDKVIK
jgi:hypothetical protein